MAKVNVSKLRKAGIGLLALLPTEFFVVGFTFISHLPLGRSKEEKKDSSKEDHHDSHDPHYFI